MARARLRRGTLKDLPVLVPHRRKMWQDIGERTRVQLDGADPVYRRWLRARLESGRCAVFVIETDGRIVASGVMWLQEAKPRPGSKATKQGYLMSMYTEPACRGRGFAARIVRASLTWARAQGVDRVTLHASAQGRGIYQREGFERSWEMRIALGKRPASRKPKP